MLFLGDMDPQHSYPLDRNQHPTLHFFNPGCELEIANAGKRAKRSAQRIRAQLEHLPLFLAQPHDLILVETLPNPRFLADLQNAGFSLPPFFEIPFSHGEPQLSHDTLAQLPQHIESINPWGWSPAALRWLAPLFPRVRPHQRPRPWSHAQAKVHSKAWASALLRDFLDQESLAPWRAWLCTPEQSATTCTSLESMLTALRSHAQKSETVVLKGIYGTSGRDMARVISGHIENNTLRWAEKIIARDQEIVVEPWHDAVADLSLRMTIEASGLYSIQGIGRFLTDRRGQYRGAVMGPSTGNLFARSIDSSVEPSLSLPFSYAELHAFYRDLADFLAEKLHAQGFAGRVGVDGLLYVDKHTTSIRLQPLLEINPRNNMGHIVEAMTTRTAPQSVSAWLFLPQPPHAPSWPERCHVLGLTPQYDDNGLIRTGALATTCPPNDGLPARIGLLLVAPTWRELEQHAKSLDLQLL